MLHYILKGSTFSVFSFVVSLVVILCKAAIAHVDGEVVESKMALITKLITN